MKRNGFLSVVTALAICVGSAPAGAERVAVHGSNTIGAQLMPALVRAYALERLDASDVEVRDTGVPEEIELIATDGTPGRGPLLEAEVHSHGSGTAFESLKGGAAVIGMSSRPIEEQERDELRVAGLGDLTVHGSEHVLALDGLVVIVNRANPLAALDLGTIARIFAGEITEWSQIGTGNGPIAVHARDDKSGTYDTFKSLVLKPNKRSLRSDAKRYESNEVLEAAVAGDPNAIGFTGFAYVKNSKPLSLQGSCGLVYAPTPYLVKTEEYPLARRLYLYTAGSPSSPTARELLDFAASDDAQTVVQDAGFIDQYVALLPFDGQGQRIAAALTQPDADPVAVRELVERLRLAERASVTFRFRFASDELDNKALADLDRLQRFLASAPEADGRKVMLLGFADSIGDAGRNKELGYQRARRVAEALRMRGVIPDEVIGIGEPGPVACNDSDIGRAVNRRVEVWLAP